MRSTLNLSIEIDHDFGIGRELTAVDLAEIAETAISRALDTPNVIRAKVQSAFIVRGPEEGEQPSPRRYDLARVPHTHGWTSDPNHNHRIGDGPHSWAGSEYEHDASSSLTVARR